MKTQGLLNCKKIQAVYLRRFLRYIPIALVVGGILFLTTQNINDSARISEGFRKLLIDFYERLGLDSSNAWWNDHLSVRRLGHILEYGLLGMASGIAFIDSQKRGVLKAIGLCLVISVLDQVIKIFVPVRHFDIVDIGFDLIGALTGVLVVTAAEIFIRKSKRS